MMIGVIYDRNYDCRLKPPCRLRELKSWFLNGQHSLFQNILLWVLFHPDQLSPQSLSAFMSNLNLGDQQVNYEIPRKPLVLLEIWLQIGVFHPFFISISKISFSSSSIDKCAELSPPWIYIWSFVVIFLNQVGNPRESIGYQVFSSRDMKTKV